MKFKRHLQWHLRGMKLQMKWTLTNQFHPFKSLFVRHRFIRLAKKMNEYASNDKAQ